VLDEQTIDNPEHVDLMLRKRSSGWRRSIEITDKVSCHHHMGPDAISVCQNIDNLVLDSTEPGSLTGIVMEGRDMVCHH
jgi:hypothetical protein